MANYIENNAPTDRNRLNRTAYDQLKTHDYYQEFSATDLGTTAVSLNGYIKAQGQGARVLGCRTHVEISNTHATANIYVKRWRVGATAASSSIYQYKLVPATGYVKVPLGPNMDLSIISDVASTTSALITELG